MKRTMIIGGLVLMIGLIESCNNRPFSPGPLTTEDRVLDDSISALIAYGSFDVFITHDTSYEVRIEAAEEIIPYIETDVVDHQLELDVRPHPYVSTKPIRIYVSAAFLNDITLKGSGNIHADSLAASHAFLKLDGSGNFDITYSSLNDITMDLEGSGNLRIAGQATSSQIELDGSGNVECKDLLVDDCYVDLEGSGNAKVHVATDLTINIDGSGNVYYWGNPPNVNVNISGSGNAIEM